ncbi:MAG: DUF5050 domain-containing protein [Clostridia bacterium]|nr:DUF5050 domain-containing protein [Clostridia bacterium]
MKKLSFIIMVLVLLLSLLFCSCDGGEKNNENENTSGNTESTTNSTNSTSPSKNPTGNSSSSTHVHAYGVWVTVAQATCKAEGSRERVCSCGSKETEKLAKINHNYVDNACTMCKAEDPNAVSPDPEEGETHVHTYGTWVTVSQATCQAEGSKVRVCSCGSTETEKLAKIKHNYVDNACTMCKAEEPNAFVPDYASGEANIVGREDAYWSCTVQAGYIYYSAGNKIQKVKKNASTVNLVYAVSAGSVSKVNVIGDWVYFYCEGSTVGKSYIAKVRTDGSGFEKIATSVTVQEMLVVKDTVYYTTDAPAGGYHDFAKDVFPLYSISANGGVQKQICDGAVSYLTADATYLYFIHETEDDDRTVCRVKHGSTAKSELLKNTNIRGLSLENSKLYFFIKDKYESYIYTLASITTTGGNYTTYGNLTVFEYAYFHVIGNKAYFIGETPYDEDKPEPEFGIMEYDLRSKTYKLIKDEYEDGFVAAFGILIRIHYDYDNVEYIEIYDPKVGVFNKTKLSQ